MVSKVHTDPRLLVTFSGTVPSEWCDYNAHMNEAAYLEVFAQSNDRVMEIIGANAAYIARGSSYFTMETHIRHLKEIRVGSELEVRSHLIASADKIIHLFHYLVVGNRPDLAATGEHLLIHVDLTTRRPSAPAQDLLATIADIRRIHSALRRPEALGKGIVLREDD